MRPAEEVVAQIIEAWLNTREDVMVRDLAKSLAWVVEKDRTDIRNQDGANVPFKTFRLADTGPIYGVWGTSSIYFVELLLNELRDAHAKLKLMGESMYTTDGTFTFPDGDYVETRKA